MYNNNISVVVPAFTGPATVTGANSTGEVLSGGAINGAIIDRLGLSGSAYPNQLAPKERPLVAKPFCLAWTTNGSTEANQQILIDTKLQHGDSSGGGDMADVPNVGSTSNVPTPRVYFSTAYSSEYLAWSTGAKYMHSQAMVGYEIGACKRFLRPVSNITVNFAATSTIATAGSVVKAMQGLIFEEFTYAPPSQLSYTTATATA